jgi:adenine phosphoribosyltransferase
MHDLKRYIADVPDFPKPGIVFRDISPLLRNHLAATTEALSALVSAAEWSQIDALAGIESRGFILAAALATQHRKGLVMARKFGKLPPPTVCAAYDLEYGTDALEMKAGTGRILLVDDVLATGGTMQAAANLCAQAGYDVRGLIVLIDLHLANNSAWRSLTIRSVIQYDQQTQKRSHAES